jgi:hypothetical protein
MTSPTIVAFGAIKQFSPIFGLTPLTGNNIAIRFFYCPTATFDIVLTGLLLK